MLNVLKNYLGHQWQPSRIYIQKSDQKYQKIWENCELFADVELSYEKDYLAIALTNISLCTPKDIANLMP